MTPLSAAKRGKTREASVSAVRVRLLRDVPPFRLVATKLLKLVGDESQPLSRIVDLLRTDAVLTGEVMSLCRSPLFCSRYEITNVFQAVGYLGLDRIASLIVTVAMRGLVTARSRFTHHCFRHNLATALICQRLAPVAGLAIDKCYVAGLIHDIGCIAFLRAYPNYGEELMAAAATVEDVRAREREIFGFDHGEAGRWLLSQWGCPIELQNVAAFHKTPQAAPTCDQSLIVLVSVCSSLANAMGMSAFPLNQSVELTEIAAPLSEPARRELLSNYPAICETTAMAVNDVEMSLL
jgi:HD-like signal output (HDOD) protein